MNELLKESVLTTTKAYGLLFSSLTHISGVVNNVYRYPALNGNPSIKKLVTSDCPRT